MPIVDSQIHIWENGRMSPQHRQIPTYSMDDALKEMAEAGVDAAVIHPPSTLGEKVNELAVEAVRKNGFLELPILGRDAEFAASLEWTHADPFDRILVAQAQVGSLTLATVDRAIRSFGGVAQIMA